MHTPFYINPHAHDEREVSQRRSLLDDVVLIVGESEPPLTERMLGDVAERSGDVPPVATHGLLRLGRS